MIPAYLSEKSVAAYLDTSVTTVRRLVEKGVLPEPTRIGTLRRWDAAALRAAVVAALDGEGGRSSRSTDPDEATRRAVEHARAHRAAPSRRRHA